MHQGCLPEEAHGSLEDGAHLQLASQSPDEEDRHQVERVGQRDLADLSRGVLVHLAEVVVDPEARNPALETVHGQEGVVGVHELFVVAVGLADLQDGRCAQQARHREEQEDLQGDHARDEDEGVQHSRCAHQGHVRTCTDPDGVADDHAHCEAVDALLERLILLVDDVLLRVLALGAALLIFAVGSNELPGPIQLHCSPASTPTTDS
mmetsp:Transcript_66552/g.177246  ORF Transcript_66552/g.177246 Transcript_66552/m.177246 type:complete len:207 (-) Transcript_66552:32-652(-)